MSVFTGAVQDRLLQMEQTIEKIESREIEIHEKHRGAVKPQPDRTGVWNLADIDIQKTDNYTSSMEKHALRSRNIFLRRESP